VFLAAVAISPAHATQAPFDQWFKVKNDAGEDLEVVIQRGEQERRSKTIGNGKTKTLKFNHLGSPSELGEKKYFSRTYTLLIRMVDQPKVTYANGRGYRERSCEFIMNYWTTGKGNKVKSRAYNSADSGCGDDFTVANDDGKTMVIKLSGTDL